MLVGLIYLTTAGFRPVGLIGEEPTAAPVGAREAEQLSEPGAPVLGARAVLLVDEPSGQVLHAVRAGERLPPASLTKLMTALLVVESGRYFDSVTIEPGDLIGGSSMGLITGETLTVRDLLDGLLVPSGNDASAALARVLGGRLAGPGRPVARFVARMNARAVELGMSETSFRNSTGLDDIGHLSTANDLALLTRVALRQPVIAQIVGQAMVTVNGRLRSYPLKNSNQLLGRAGGVIGVKTGTTEAAGECLILLVERDGRRLLAVLLGSSERYQETTALIDWGFARFRWLAPPDGLAEAGGRPGWLANLAGGPAIAVPVGQVQFVEYRLRPPPTGRLDGSQIETLLFGRTIASRSIELTFPGRLNRPQVGW
jgi:D-alanyl-D-alanine carboxypeptidase